MCGIVAIINNYKNGFQVNDMDIFKEMLYADALRGEDATGIIGIDNKGNAEYAKAAVTPEVFFGKKEVESIFDTMWHHGSALIGHNRKATIGNKGDANNAHPFHERDVILVHNGSINQFHELMPFDKRKEVNIDVDSHVVAYLMANEPDYQQVVRDVHEINGAYVFVWYNAKEKKIRVVKNDARPLGFIFNRETGVLYIASELDMLRWIVGRNKGLAKDSKDMDVGEFKNHVVNEYTLEEDGGWSYTAIPMENMEKRPAYNSGWGNGAWGRVTEVPKREPKVVDIKHQPGALPNSFKEIPTEHVKNFRMEYDALDAPLLPYERVCFVIDDYDQHKSNKENVWQFEGTMCNNPNVKIRGIYKGDESQLCEAENPPKGFAYDMVMAGFIRTITTDAKSDEAVIWVEKAAQIPFVLMQDDQVVPMDLYDWVIDKEDACDNMMHQLKHMKMAPDQLICYTCEKEQEPKLVTVQ